MQYYTVVFGCQMNISDSERISAVLESLKYRKASLMDEADLIAVVMCSVRQSAVDRVQSLMQKLKDIRKINPGLKAVLTGCVLKKDKKIFLQGFDFVIDIKDIKKLPEILGTKKAAPPDNYLSIVPKHSSKFSASVPIMTGCNNFCAYCVVPYVREREISRPYKEIISEVKNLVNKGYKEIWLLGQNVNSYNDNGIDFPKLLKMTNKIPGEFWLRFTSSHPKDFNNDVIDAMAEGKHITPYLNLPVQAGDNAILKSMNRHYTATKYKKKISELRKKIPGICLSTDIIVGFPGETKKHFKNTAKLFEDIRYDMAYINKYSPRSGTAAAKLKDDIPWPEKKRREKVLNDILRQTALDKNKKFAGKTVTVLIDSRKDGNFFGKSEHYKTVGIQSDKNLVGKFVKVKITQVMSWALKGEPINE